MLYASSLSQRKPIQSQQEGHRWSSARAPERTSELLNKGIEEQQQRNEQHHSNRFCSLSFLFYSYFSFISLHPSLLFLLCKTMCFPLYLYYEFFKKSSKRLARRNRLHFYSILLSREYFYGRASSHWTQKMAIMGASFQGES